MKCWSSSARINQGVHRDGKERGRLQGSTGETDSPFRPSGNSPSTSQSFREGRIARRLPGWGAVAGRGGALRQVSAGVVNGNRRLGEGSWSGGKEEWGASDEGGRRQGSRRTNHGKTGKLRFLAISLPIGPEPAVIYGKSASSRSAERSRNGDRKVFQKTSQKAVAENAIGLTIPEPTGNVGCRRPRWSIATRCDRLFCPLMLMIFTKSS